MKKIIVIILIFFISFQLISCSRDKEMYNEILNTIYIDSIGIDYNKETKNYIVYFHSTSIQSLVTSEMGSSSSSSTFSIASHEAPSIYEAIILILNNTNKSILLTHVRSIVLSINFISMDNLIMLDKFISTYKSLTIDLNIFVTTDNIKDIFSYVNPDGANTYYSILTDLDNIIPFKTTHYKDFTNALHEKHKEIRFNTISVTENVWSDDESNFKTLYTTGYAYIKNDEVLILENNYFSFLPIMYANSTAHLVYDNINYDLKKIKLKITDRKVKISANVYVTNITNDNQEDILKTLEYNLIKDFNHIYNYSTSKNFDIFNIKDQLYRKNKLKDDFNFETISFTFDFNFRILS